MSSFQASPSHSPIPFNVLESRNFVSQLKSMFQLTTDTTQIIGKYILDRLGGGGERPLAHIYIIKEMVIDKVYGETEYHTLILMLCLLIMYLQHLNQATSSWTSWSQPGVVLISAARLPARVRSPGQ